MKFFLDTANLEEIRKAAALGLADGVTTNPTLISKEGNVDFKQHIAEICKIVSGPVSAEVTTPDKDEMLRQGREYVKIAPNVVIKRLLEEIIEIYDNYGWKTEVLAASLRHPIHVIEAARMGADIGTMPYKVLEQLLKHPLTDKGQDQFLADWNKRAAKA